MHSADVVISLLKTHEKKLRTKSSKPQVRSHLWCVGVAALVEMYNGRVQESNVFHYSESKS